jgi:hypothetical protein
MKLPENYKDAEPWSADDQIPPGLYIAAIVDCKEEVSKKQNPMLVITWRIVVGDMRGAEIKDWVTVIESTAGKVVALMQALAYVPPADGMLQANALVGKRAQIVVRNEPFTGDDGEVRETPKVKGHRPLDNGSDVDSNAAAFVHSGAPADDDVPF